MPRPFRKRRIRFQPGITHFKPAGIPVAESEEIVLKMEELEAVRLKDHEEKGQIESAKKMNISQPTFNRLLRTARKKISEALVEGKAIKIEGGSYKMVQQNRQFSGRGMGRGAGRGRMGRFAAGPGGVCRCPGCGHEEPHSRGTPCYQVKCPKCGANMTRG